MAALVAARNCAISKLRRKNDRGEELDENSVILSVKIESRGAQNLLLDKIRRHVAYRNCEKNGPTPGHGKDAHSQRDGCTKEGAELTNGEHIREEALELYALRGLPETEVARRNS
jgi:hypothetical protein